MLEGYQRLQRIVDAAKLEPSPAIALTIATVQRSTSDKVYALVRTPRHAFRIKFHGRIGHFVSVERRPETNLTHPNVLSAPTDRIPRAVFDAIPHGREVQPLRKPHRPGYTFFEPCAVSSVGESGHHPLVYAVDSILAKKMGLVDAIESGKFTYRAWLAAVLSGNASYTFPAGSGLQNLEEPMRMANVFVEVSDAAMQCIPGASKAYNVIQKLTLREFKDRYWSSPSSSSGTINGLCLPSTITVLNQFEEELDNGGSFRPALSMKK